MQYILHEKKARKNLDREIRVLENYLELEHHLLCENDTREQREAFVNQKLDEFEAELKKPPTAAEIRAVFGERSDLTDEELKYYGGFRSEPNPTPKSMPSRVLDSLKRTIGVD